MVTEEELKEKNNTEKTRKVKADSTGKKTEKKNQVNSQEASVKLYHVFKFLAKITHSQADFTKTEFKEAGEQYADMSVYSPIFARILKFLAPLGLLGELFEKFQKLSAGIPEKTEGKPSMFEKIRSRMRRKNADSDETTVQGTRNISGS